MRINGTKKKEVYGRQRALFMGWIDRSMEHQTADGCSFSIENRQVVANAKRMTKKEVGTT